MPRKKLITRKKVSSGLKSSIYNLKGEVVGEILLPAEIFASKVNPNLIAQAVRVYLANQRLGTHSTKTRAEVSGSTRKIYRQKGTGRARHGDIKAPIFIGGGITHGPKPRDYSLSLPTKMKKLALFAALTDKFQQGKLKIVSGIESISPKTREMVNILKNLNLGGESEKKNGILLALSGNARNVILSGRNLEYLSLTSARLLNTYAVVVHRNLLFTQDAIGILNEKLEKHTPEKSLEKQKAKMTKSSKVPAVQRETVKKVQKATTKKRKSTYV